MRIAGFLLVLLLLAPSAQAARTMQDYHAAVLRLLDKATARVEQIELERGKPYSFGGMQVELRSCQQTPPEEEPESAAFLVVQSLKQEDKGSILFRGWMFASNPALSALEHPLYDVWVIACKKPVTNAASPASTPAAAAPASVPPAVGATAPAAPASAAPASPTPAKTEELGLPVPVPGYVPPMATPPAPKSGNPNRQ